MSELPPEPMPGQMELDFTELVQLGQELDFGEVDDIDDDECTCCPCCGCSCGYYEDCD